MIENYAGSYIKTLNNLGFFFVVSTEEKHTGPVAALDFNPFQSNLLASG